MNLDFLSFSQRGEDKIIKRLLEERGVKKPYYLDLGCGDPIEISNTFKSYLQGGSGWVVDANPKLEDKWLMIRRRDNFLNALISIDTKPKEFYVTNYKHRSTSDYSEIKKLVDDGNLKVTVKIDDPLVIEAKNIPYYPDFELGRTFDLVSVDVEGATLGITKAMLETGFRPTVLCVELDWFNHSVEESGLYKPEANEFIQFMNGWGYFIGGYTSTNTIFVLKKAKDIEAQR